MADSPGTTQKAILTDSDLLSAREEIDKLDASVRRRRQRIAEEEAGIRDDLRRRGELEQFFTVVEAFLASRRPKGTSRPDIDVQIPPPPPADSRASDSNERLPRGIWQFTLPELIEAAGKGLIIGEIRAAARAHPKLQGFEFSEHAVDQGLYKLQKKKLIVRRGSLYYTAAMLKNGEPSGDDKLTEVKSRQGEIASAILELPNLRSGMTSSEIITELRRDPELDSKLGAKAGTAYNALARFREQKILIRDGNIYRLPPQTNEPPKALANDGSNSGSVNGSTPSLDLNPARLVQ